MTTRADKIKMLEQIKGNTVIDYQTFIDSKFNELQAFNKQFKRDWNSNHEKVAKQMEEKRKQLESLAEEWLELAHPDIKNIWKDQYTIQIVISKDQE